MTMLKTIYLGTIQLGRETLFIVNRPTLHDTIYALNDWMFFYLYSNGFDPRSLPPLDDWTHSQEDVSFWSIHFPDEEWTISVKSEMLEFK